VLPVSGRLRAGPEANPRRWFALQISGVCYLLILGSPGLGQHDGGGLVPNCHERAGIIIGAGDRRPTAGNLNRGRLATRLFHWCGSLICL